MNNVIKAIGMGLFGVAGAYLLNVVFKYNEDASLNYWLIMIVAFVIGSYVGLIIREKRKK